MQTENDQTKRKFGEGPRRRPEILRGQLLKNGLTNPQAATRIGVNPETLQKWRRLKKSPPYYKLAGQVFYLEADLDDWLAMQRVEA